MTAAENPLDVLRDTADDLADVAVGWCSPKARGNERLVAARLEAHEAALSAVEQLVEAARRLNDKRAYPIQRDWSALAEALARFPVPAQDTGGET